MPPSASTTPKAFISVARVTSLADFMVEVPAPAVVRLLHSATSANAFIQRHAISLFGISATNELVWLTEQRRVDYVQGSPFGEEAESLVVAMPQLFQIVQGWLTQQGYIVRKGDYAMQEGLLPLGARFECAKWLQDGAKWQVEPSAPLPPAALTLPQVLIQMCVRVEKVCAASNAPLSTTQRVALNNALIPFAEKLVIQ